MNELNRLEDGTIKITISIPSLEVKKTWEEVVQNIAKTSNVAGFRKGKAPKKLVEEKVDKVKVREEVLKKLLPQAYLEAVKQHNLRPIINPKVHVEKLEEGKDWQFIALTCEAPEINLNQYKESIQRITAKAKIIVPGKESEQPKFEEIVKALLDSITIKIPKILIEGEVDRLLAQTLDEVKRLGLSLEQYLESTHRTVENLRAEYETKAENDIKLEFALQKVAEDEHIKVEDKEIEEAIQKAKDATEKNQLESNRYLLAGILRQQKTLDFLKNL